MINSVDKVTTVIDNTCNINCQYDWLAVSSNFFNISVYTPALIVGLVVFAAYRYAKKLRDRNKK